MHTGSSLARRDGRTAGRGASQPIRVGGNIKPPSKVHDVRPVYPDEALRRSITGLVIIEAIVGVDGRVSRRRKSSRAFRCSIPRQSMRSGNGGSSPHYLNGAPVPVIMTVTVSFNLR